MHLKNQNIRGQFFAHNRAKAAFAAENILDYLKTNSVYIYLCVSAGPTNIHLINTGIKHLPDTYEPHPKFANLSICFMVSGGAFPVKRKRMDPYFPLDLRVSQTFLEQKIIRNLSKTKRIGRVIIEPAHLRRVLDDGPYKITMNKIHHSFNKEIEIT